MSDEKGFETCSNCLYDGVMTSGWWCNEITRDNCQEYKLDLNGETIGVARKVRPQIDYPELEVAKFRHLLTPQTVQVDEKYL